MFAEICAPLIEFASVEKVYRMGQLDYHAVRGVDLSIGGGELVAIVGPFGSGKTTILNLITGIDRPTAGTVTVDGERLEKMTEEELAVWRGANVGILPVLPAAADTVGARERGAAARLRAARVKAGAVRSSAAQPLSGRARRQGRSSAVGALGGRAAARCDRALARVGPEADRGRRADRQSRHRHGTGDVRAARAVDEEGKTVLYVTHDLELARRAHRIVSIRDGVVVGS
jgi:putative ABC transport system ATP-binding protein